MRAARWVAAAALDAALLVALDTALYDASTDDPRAEAAVVLGAAVWDSVPSPVFAARLDHAAALVLEGRVDRVLLTGGTRDPGVQAESAVGRRYLLEAGVPDSVVVAEASSRTTWQNLVCVRPEIDGPVLLVSDPLHLRRAVSMARDLGIEAEPSATPTSRYRSVRSRAPFLARETYFRLADGVAGVVGARGGCPGEVSGRHARPDPRPLYAANTLAASRPKKRGCSTRSTMTWPSAAVVSSTLTSPCVDISITTRWPSWVVSEAPARGESHREASRLISTHESRPNGAFEDAARTSRTKSVAKGSVSARGGVGMVAGGACRMIAPGCDTPVTRGPAYALDSARIQSGPAGRSVTEPWVSGGSPSRASRHRRASVARTSVASDHANCSPMQPRRPALKGR